MDRMDQEKLARPSVNSYTLWAKFTPEHERFKQKIVQAPIHIIATMRSKQDYVLSTNEKGKQEPKKVGMAPIQRDQFEYEFTTVFDLSMEHYTTVSKDRTGLFDGQNFRPSAETGARLLTWLEAGIEPAEAAPAQDGSIPHTPIPAELQHWKVPGGRWIGKVLCEIPVQELRASLRTLENRDGGAWSPAEADTLAKWKEYLGYFPAQASA